MAEPLDITGKSCDGSGEDYWDAGSVLVAYATRWPVGCALPADCVRFSPGIDIDGVTVEIFRLVDNLVTGEPATVGPYTLYYRYEYNCGNGGYRPYLGDGIKSFQCTGYGNENGSWVIYDPAPDAGCDPATWPTHDFGYAPARAAKPLLRYVGPTLAISGLSLWQNAYNGFYNGEQVPILYAPDGSVVDGFEVVADDGYSNRQYKRTGAFELTAGVYLSPLGIADINDAYYAIEAFAGTPAPVAFWTDLVGCMEG